jgi:HD-like signal output (HDOD) protein/DNA-binding NarL/FixJ family response regulator
MATGPTVLVVDDEQTIREVLVTLLRIHQCQIVGVASNGEEALALYQQHKPEITLLDITMRGMSGIDVLRQIRAWNSQSFVSMVTADSTIETIRDASSLGASGYLVKPIVPTKIQGLLSNYQRVKEKNEEAPISLVTPKNRKTFYPSDEELRVAHNLVDSISFPAIPEAVLALQEELMASEPDMERIATVISSDIKLSGMLLRLVNSAAYGLDGKISSIPHAVVVLGLDTLKGALLASALRSTLGDESEFDHDYWKQASITAIICAKLAKSVLGVNPDEAFLAGMFQDSGGLLFQRKHPRYQELYSYSHSIPVALLEYERKLFKTTHLAVSYLLARRWELPEQVCDAILLSHNLDYSSFKQSEVADLQALVSIMKVGNYVVGKQLHNQIQVKEEGMGVQQHAMEELMIDDEVVADAAHLVDQVLEESV